MALRVAAIDFLNPAPLMWDFNHDPFRAALRLRYDVHLTFPSRCAEDLLTGRADIGLIPVAALTPDLLIVPGCAIASLHRVRSIQLIVKGPRELAQVRTIAADTASRSSVAYAKLLFRHFLGTDPEFKSASANVEAMLEHADAALLIGDPALLALEHRVEIEARVGPCHWYDLAEEWHTRTGLPWVAAVWAVRRDAVSTGDGTDDRWQIIQDFNLSRDHGLAHIDALVIEWSTRIALPPATISTYLKENIHYILDESCVQAIQTFRALAAQAGILDPLPELLFLDEGSGHKE